MRNKELWFSSSNFIILPFHFLFWDGKVTRLSFDKLPLNNFPNWILKGQVRNCLSLISPKLSPVCVWTNMPLLTRSQNHKLLQTTFHPFPLSRGLDELYPLEEVGLVENVVVDNVEGPALVRRQVPRCKPVSSFVISLFPNFYSP